MFISGTCHADQRLWSRSGESRAGRLGKGHGSPSFPRRRAIHSRLRTEREATGRVPIGVSHSPTREVALTFRPTVHEQTPPKPCLGLPGKRDCTLRRAYEASSPEPGTGGAGGDHPVRLAAGNVGVVMRRERPRPRLGLVGARDRQVFKNVAVGPDPGSSLVEPDVETTCPYDLCGLARAGAALKRFIARLSP